MIAPECDNILVRRQRFATQHSTRDTASGGSQCVDRSAPHEPNARLLRHCGQTRSEQMAVASLVSGQAKASGEFLLHQRQGGLRSGTPVGVQELVGGTPHSLSTSMSLAAASHCFCVRKSCSVPRERPS